MLKAPSRGSWPTCSAWQDRARCLKVEVHAPYTVAACRDDLERAGFATEIYKPHRASVIARHRSLFPPPRSLTEAANHA